MSVSATPFQKWDMERAFRTNPLLTTTDKAVGLELLQLFYNDKREQRPVIRDKLLRLRPQRVIGRFASCRRETVCRSLAKLVKLGYFRKRLVSVAVQTRQGIKGVTRVFLEPGRFFTSGKFAAQARSVTSDHTPGNPAGNPGTDCTSVITTRTDRKGLAASSSRENRPEILENWPRLAGSRSDVPALRPERVPAAELGLPLGIGLGRADPAANSDYAAARAALAARRQPKRLPRSKRKG